MKTPGPEFPHSASNADPTAARRRAAAAPRGRRAPRAVLALATACLLFCVPAAAAGAGGAKKGPRKAPAAKADKSKAGAGEAASKEESATPAKPAQAKPEHIGIEHEQSAYPPDGGLRKYKLVVRHKAGDKFFETDPRLLSLGLAPAGAEDVTVRLATPTRIEADFWAPENFKVSEVSVSVRDRDNPELIAASSDVEKPKEGEKADKADAARSAKAKAEGDTAQPKINSTAIVFLQRAYGIGRMKIEGENFGNYGAPPVAAEEYLLCYEPLARQALLDGLKGNPQAKAQQAVEDKRCDDLRGTDKYARWKEWREKVERSVKVALVPRNTDLRIEQAKVLYIDDKLIDVYFEFNRYYRNSEPLRLASTTVTVRKGDPPKPESKAAAKTQTAAGGGGRPVGDAVMLNASAGAPAAAAEEVKPDPFADERKTYIATKEVGTRQDENLEYRYTVLDSASATTLFGKGVADSFYVIQLSVTNKGDKKVAIPLASIQAEVEWAYGPQEQRAQGARRASKGAKDSPADMSFAAPASYADAAKSAGGPAQIQVSQEEMTEYYEEGPATLAPLPLPAVTAFFDGDMKVNGKKAKFFNVTDGLATLGSSLIPFFGPGFRDAHVAFTGGLVPGIRRGLGDLSSQQLQNLTALSWQGVEVVAAKGGSLEKFVFIQRGDQVFSPGFGERLRKTIKNIEGMEVVGFAVQESDAKRATPAGQQ